MGKTVKQVGWQVCSFSDCGGKEQKKHHQLCLSSGREHKAGFLLQGGVNGALSTRNTTYCVVKSQQLCSVGLDAALADLDSTADGEERNQWESGGRGERLYPTLIRNISEQKVAEQLKVKVKS